MCAFLLSLKGGGNMNKNWHWPVARIEKNIKDADEASFINSISLEEHYKIYEAQGFSKNEIIKKIAKDRNVNKNEIYMYFI